MAKVLDDSKINAFFVVAKKDEVMYKKFSDMMQQADTAIFATEEASSIVDHISEYYTVCTVSAFHLPFTKRSCALTNYQTTKF